MSVERIVVTGMGAVTPYGIGVDKLWDSLVAGHCAVNQTRDEALREFAPVSAEVPDFDPREKFSEKFVRDTTRFTQFALFAAMEATLDAGMSDGEPKTFRPGTSSERIGIFIGTGIGSLRDMDAGAAALALDASAHVGPRLISKSIPNAPAATLAAQFGIHGPVLTYTTACASSANAIGEAMMWLKSGKIDIAIAGGTDSLFAPSLLASLREAGALAARGNGDFSTWSRPFDKERQGMAPGEGSALLVLESAERAKARNAKIHAELIGYGTSNDGYHQIAPEPGGRGGVLAIRQALLDAGLEPNDIDYINAHATATRAGDASESRAFLEAFGEDLPQIPVSSIKGHIGHTLGAAASIEAVACIRALQTGWLPPNMNCDDPDEGTPPNLIRHEAVERPIRTALSTSFGFGGQNGVLIFRKPQV
ncbi:beta-ketoacyl-[acyl-carrier-protein] synthase family protein [Alicyclobacillus tolerans]|uniref:beta-ketoacyl-[acyl-carrier-protein] synthase family protein n=1 Tax=Alicyclobacillus tolerans TaxID=90970 RepID=UPI001F2E7D25|nr:beta-ketoacyl-[acyl-carrier-protein] synthase family protein [Alicyclobacillus tolerans]MCF8566663.1 beta-ketoacyl-[acyl-carrier-protein] synthase family protein [Alicyclobacillus tolerans]